MSHQRYRGRDKTYLLALALSNGSSFSGQTVLLLDLGFRTVLVHELEELSSGVLIESVGELGNGGGNLEALVENDLLSLETDVFGPFNKAGEVGLGLDILAYTESQYEQYVQKNGRRPYQCQSF
jgi:hypothetical protein